jgi:hypothetical protein
MESTREIVPVIMISISTTWKLGGTRWEKMDGK